jgi:hypothetical protein
MEEKNYRTPELYSTKAAVCADKIEDRHYSGQFHCGCTAVPLPNK